MSALSRMTRPVTAASKISRAIPSLSRSIVIVKDVKYAASSTATGAGRNGGTVKLDGEKKLEYTLSMPKELSGKAQDPNGVDPEQLISLGYAGCFLSGLGAAASKLKIKLPPTTAVKAIMSIGTPEVGVFGIRAEIVVSGLEGIENKDELVKVAHGICPYSRAFEEGIQVSARAE